MNSHRYYGEGPVDGIVWVDVEPQPPGDWGYQGIMSFGSNSHQAVWSKDEKNFSAQAVLKDGRIVKCEEWGERETEQCEALGYGLTLETFIKPIDDDDKWVEEYNWKSPETMPLEAAGAQSWLVKEVLGVELVELKDDLPDFEDGPDLDNVVFDKKWQWKVSV